MAIYQVVEECNNHVHVQVRGENWYERIRLVIGILRFPDKYGIHMRLPYTAFEKLSKGAYTSPQTTKQLEQLRVD